MEESLESGGVIRFCNDYMEGAHPSILKRLADTNLEQTAGYGLDPHSEHARELIREACECPGADVFFLVGGTQTNETVISSMLMPWQGVLAASTGHVSLHEAGAIEHGGHKVFQLPGVDGKIDADQVERFAALFEADASRDHMVEPGMVYVSQPTEYGTLYTLAQMRALSRAAHAHGMKFYVDGARLAYGLAAPGNDVELPDLARLCDAFYIGGTKCGALFGEAVVVPEAGSIPHFFTQIKQHGALLAKGRVLGMQFEVLFEDGLYLRIGRTAVEAAQRIRAALDEAGYAQHVPSATNQTFVLADDALLARLDGKVEYDTWEHLPDGTAVIRLTTSWATRSAAVERLVGILSGKNGRALPETS